MEGDSTMEDLEQPSTSKKKETQKTHSSEDTKESSRADQKSNSKTSMSNQSSYSGKSRNSSGSGLKMPKTFSKSRVNREREDRARNEKEKEDSKRSRENLKRTRCLTGRVDKKPVKRRRLRRPRRMLRARSERRKRDVSVTSIVTKLSSGIKSPCCKYCGHRCCRRRYEYDCRKRGNRRYGRTYRRRNVRARNKIRIDKNTRASKVSVSHQVGSRCKMLSPLFIKSNSEPTEQEPHSNKYSEVTPEMIYEALRRLCMWRQEIKTEAILEYIKTNYPVTPDVNALAEDLMEKLTVAATVGIVTPWGNGGWALPTALQERSLRKTHVTVFWQVYADTMTPFGRREQAPQTTNKEDKETDNGII